MISGQIKTFIKKIGVSILSIGMLLYFESCGSNMIKTEEDRKQYVIPDSILRVIRFDTVKQGALVNSITLTGQVDFNQDKVINIFPLISGNIQDIKVALGDYVNQGDVLGVIKSAEMSQYSSDLLNAQSNLRLAEMTLEKTADMYKRGLASKTDSLSSAVGLQQAKAEITRVERVLKIVGGNTQGDFVVKAPISGFIVQKMVNNNQTIRTDNAGPLFTISDLKDVWVWANAYESNVTNIHLNDEVQISTLSHPDRIFKGKVDKIMQVLDPASKAMKVRISIPNNDYALKPQMFASITITNTESQQAIYIPFSALIFDHSQYYVLVYKGKGKADITPVTKLNTVDKKTYLTSGVKIGEQVISSDALSIYSELNN
jgi:cobalt-zinc-cadmium efflux system membrane fusion protein